MHQYKPGLPLFKNSTMAFKVGKQFVSIQVRSKKFYKGVLYKSSLHLEREIEEKRERKRSRKFKVGLYHCSLFTTKKRFILTS